VPKWLRVGPHTGPVISSLSTTTTTFSEVNQTLLRPVADRETSVECEFEPSPLRVQQFETYRIPVKPFRGSTKTRGILIFSPSRLLFQAGPSDLENALLFLGLSGCFLSLKKAYSPFSFRFLPVFLEFCVCPTSGGIKRKI
jgi:hypothetical protein